jgi:hypothetical protein
MTEPPIFADHIPARNPGRCCLFVSQRRNYDLIADDVVLGQLAGAATLYLSTVCSAFTDLKYLIHISA